MRRGVQMRSSLLLRVPFDERPVVVRALTGLPGAPATSSSFLTVIPCPCTVAAETLMTIRKTVWVVGISDIGRSPRLQNHAICLAVKGGFEVEVVGQVGSRPLARLLENNAIHLNHLPEVPAMLSLLPKLISLPLKAILQTVQLLLLLLLLPKPELVLLQVPPAIPVLAVAWLVCFLRGARLVIDWHNYAYTLMALSSGSQSLLVRLAERFEKFWARRGHAHLCVTHAMREDLERNWHVKATVFHDRPPAGFRRTSDAEKHDLLLRLKAELETPLHAQDFCTTLSGDARRPRTRSQTPPPRQGSPGSVLLESPAQEALPDVLESFWTGKASPAKQSPKASPRDRTPTKMKEGRRTSEVSTTSSSSPADQETEVTICTERQVSSVRLRNNRPALIVSSTSWTPDEDFGILLDAADLYEAKVRAGDSQLPRLLVLVTGKGPQRDAYRARMRQAEHRYVAFRTLWLEPADYPLLLGACDVGVSLHTSSSGLDLPMKVVDMFGCGLPVFTAAYPCISELVQPDVNGVHFTSASELADGLADVLQGFPQAPSKRLRKLQEAVASDPRGSWDVEWEKVVLPIVKQELATSGGSERSKQL